MAERYLTGAMTRTCHERSKEISVFSNGMTGAKQRYRSGAAEISPKILQIYYGYIASVLQPCYMYIAGVLQNYYRTLLINNLTLHEHIFRL